MKYVDIKRGTLLNDIPHLIYFLENLEKGLGSELSIRDTDHTYAPISIEGLYDPSSRAISDHIHDYCMHHCCKCGRTTNICPERPRGYEDYGFGLCICEDCMEEHLFKNYYIYEDLVNEIQEQTYDPSYKARHIKLRLKTTDGHFIYRFLKEVRLENNEFVVNSNINPQQKEIVKIVGWDIGLRDMNDERVYEGDILLAETEDGRRFCGTVKKYRTYDGYSLTSPQWMYYTLYHDGHNSPTSLAQSVRFKIIGTIGNIKDFDGYKIYDHQYEKWYEENKHLVFLHMDLSPLQTRR
jgi:hypothetical protein